jgi:hypothetical protein
MFLQHEKLQIKPMHWCLLILFVAFNFHFSILVSGLYMDYLADHSGCAF